MNRGVNIMNGLRSVTIGTNGFREKLKLYLKIYSDINGQTKDNDTFQIAENNSIHYTFHKIHNYINNNNNNR